MQFGPLPQKSGQSPAVQENKSEHEYFVKAIKKLATLSAITDVNKRLPINMEVLYKLAKEEFGENGHIFVENYLECYTHTFNQLISETLVSNQVSTKQTKMPVPSSPVSAHQEKTHPKEVEIADEDTDEDTNKKSKKSLASITAVSPMPHPLLSTFTPQYKKIKLEELDEKKVLRLAHERGSVLGRKGRSAKGLDMAKVTVSAKNEFGKYADLYIAEYVKSHKHGLEVYHERMKNKKSPI